MTSDKHTAVVQTLHWLTFVAVLAAYVIGVYREELPKGDFRALLLQIHMSIGIFIIAITTIRLYVRTSVSPYMGTRDGTLIKLAAKFAHRALYFLLFVVPLIGLAAAWAKARDISFFGLFIIPAPFSAQAGFVKPLENLHELAANMMMLLIGGHAAASLFHQLVLKDGTLNRMLPSKS